MIACGPREKTPEQITSEITRARGQIAKLNDKITELESQLAATQTGEVLAGTKVRAEGLTLTNFATFVKTSAMVEAVNAAMVSPEMNGRIMNIRVKKGQKVSKGQVLITLDDEVLTNSLAEMDKGLELTKTTYEKQKELYAQGVGSEMQYLEVENRYESMLKARKSLLTQIEKTQIVAPFSGYVETIFQKVGETATPGRQIVELISLDKLYINTELSESYISDIKQGDTVWVSFPNLPDIEKIAKIDQAGKVIDPGSRTFSVRVNMENQGEQIRPNMLATIKFRDYAATQMIVVPTVMIRHDLEGDFVFLARPHDGDYFAHKAYVTAGKSDGEHTVILDGLKAGDLLITSGYNQIKDGNQIDLVN